MLLFNLRSIFVDTTRLRSSFITVETENAGDSAGSADSHSDSKLRQFNDITVSEYASTILNNRATKERLISKFSRYDMMTGVVSAESFFTFTNDDVQFGIEPDRRSKLLKTFVKHTYR